MNMTMRLAIEMALIHYGLPQEGVDGVEQQMEEMTDEQVKRRVQRGLRHNETVLIMSLVFLRALSRLSEEMEHDLHRN